jgi:hypothetical protein
MSDIYLAVSETPTVVTLTNAVINSAVASSVTVMNTVTVALDANSLSALENVTVTVGAAITGTVTIGAGTAQIGSVTIGNSVTIGSLPAISGTVTAMAGTNFSTEIYQGILTYAGNEGGDGAGAFYVNVGSLYGPLPAGTNRIGVVTIGAGTVTIGAGTAQIGSVTASISGTVPVSISSVTVGNSVTIGSLPAISGTVTANIGISSTAITSGVFSSLTSATLVPGNTLRKMATVYNLGAGQLFVNAGVTATTLGGGFMVALSSGDFYECDYTTTTLSAIFATAGTASWVSH